MLGLPAHQIIHPLTPSFQVGARPGRACIFERVCLSMWFYQYMTLYVYLYIIIIKSRCAYIAYISWSEVSQRSSNISPNVLHNKQLSHLRTFKKLSREQQPQLALEKMGTKRYVFPGSPTTIFSRLVSEPTFFHLPKGTTMFFF